MANSTEYLYRYWPTPSYGWDEEKICSDINHPSFEFNPTAYRIIKRTKCGAWINNYGKKKFVNLTTRKQWAYENLELAKIGMIRRKEKHVKILETELEIAKEQLRAANAGLFNTTPMNTGDF